MENELIKIDNDTLAALPAGQFEGRIVVVERAEQLAEACARLSAEKIIGFDTETRPCFRAGEHHSVALLQLSCADVCYLFRLSAFPPGAELVKLLENPAVMKVGLDIGNDIRAVQGVRRFRPAGFVDLQGIIRDHGIGELGLRKMAALVLGIRISKAQRLSNWEAAALTQAQQLYAATDAWVSREIYVRLTGD